MQNFTRVRVYKFVMEKSNVSAFAFGAADVEVFAKFFE